VYTRFAWHPVRARISAHRNGIVTIFITTSHHLRGISPLVQPRRESKLFSSLPWFKFTEFSNAFPKQSTQPGASGRDNFLRRKFLLYSPRAWLSLVLVHPRPWLITGRVQLSSAFIITGFHPTSNGIKPINYTFIQPRILTIACCAVYIQLAARINISRGVATWVLYTVYIYTHRCSDTFPYKHVANKWRCVTSISFQWTERRRNNFYLCRAYKPFFMTSTQSCPALTPFCHPFPLLYHRSRGGRLFFCESCQC